MKTYDVLKPFNTVNRRLVVGASIRDGEPIEPFTFEERAKSGFLKEHVDEAPKDEPHVMKPAAQPVPVARPKVDNPT